MTSLRHTFCDRLRQAIKADARSVNAIAVRAGYNPSYVRRMILGLKANPTLEFVEVMAQTLGCDPAWLLGLNGKDEGLNAD